MSRLPDIKTRRLVLRGLQQGDTEAIISLGNRDFEIVRWLTGAPWPYEQGATEAYVERVLTADPLDFEAVFAITLGGVFIGVVSIATPGDLQEQADCPTLGYWLGRPFHGFGYASEAVESVLRNR